MRCPNPSNVVLFQFGSTVLLSFNERTVSPAILIVLRRGAPGEIAEPVVASDAIKVPALKTSWARTDKRQKHKRVDRVGLALASVLKVHGRIALRAD
jgi:hypothetical protein